MQMMPAERTAKPLRGASGFSPFGLMNRVFATRLRRRVAMSLAAVILIVALGIGGAVGWLMLRLSSGPLEFASLESGIEEAVAEALGGVDVDVGAAQLVDEKGGIVVHVRDVTIRNAAGATLVQTPRAKIGVGLLSAALGNMTPTTVELVGPQLSVHRYVDGSVRLGFGAGGVEAGSLAGSGAAPEKASAGDFRAPAEDAVDVAVESLSLESLLATSGGGALSGLKHITVREAQLTVYDDASRSIWDASNASLTIRRPGTALAISLDAPFSTDSGEWRLRLEVHQTDIGEPILARAGFENIVPTEIAARMQTLSDLSGLDLPVSGEVATSVTPDGQIESVTARLDFGAGFVRRVPLIGEDIAPMLIDEAQIIATYNRAETRVDIDRFAVLFGSNLLDLAGTVEPEFDAAGDLQSARFDLRSDDMQVASPNIARPAIDVQKALATGKVSIQPFLVEVDTLLMEIGAGRVVLGGAATLGDTRALTVQGQAENLDADSLVQLWPGDIAPGARAWIASRIPRGTIDQARIAVDLGPEALAMIDADQPLPEQAMAIEFGFSGVTANYLEGLPPLEEAKGSASLSGDRFTLSVESAQATGPSGDRVAVNFGRFSVPSLVSGPLGDLVGEIDVSTLSPMRGALEILDLEPLGFTRELGIDPSGVTGNAQILIDLTLPLSSDVTFADIQVRAGATLTQVLVPEAFEGIQLEAPELEVIATHQRIEAAGDIRLNGILAKAKWDARLDGTAERTNLLELKADVNVEELAGIGVDLSDIVVGRAPLEIEARGTGATLETMKLVADVTDTEVRVPALGWQKDEGTPARLSLDVERLENDQIRLGNIDLSGPDFSIAGAVRFDPDGSLYKFDLGELRLGDASNLVLNGLRGEDGVMRVKVNGSSLDAKTLLERSLESSEPVVSGDDQQPLEIDFAIDRVVGLENTALRRANGRVRTREGKVTQLRLKGAFESGGGLQIDYGLGSGETPAVVSVDTSDAGALVRYMGLYKRAFGGSMAVRARGPDGKNLQGTITARDFSVREEPLLIRIAGSQTGLSPAVARNVAFSRLNLQFSRNNGVLTIRDGLIAGPAVGASLRGRVDIAGESLGLSGTYIPAYGFNAAFGAIPIVGPILSGRTGEGILGMTFGVNGPMADPTIKISPISTIAPGFLRRFFEFRRQ